jgi:DNA-binding transcriptional LysR family regulator
MTIQQLKYISAVEKYGSITKAAQKLYVSQPSVSAVIHALEEELGIEIFVRSAKGITITEQGRELLKMGNKILHDVDYIEEFFSAPGKEEKPSFYVASQHYDFVCTAFEQFVQSASTRQYSFGLIHGQTAEILENVRKQYCNLGVIFLSAANRSHMEKALSDRHLAFHSLATTVPHVFVSRDHPLADRQSVRQEELADYPCICYEQDYADPGFFSEEIILLSDFYPQKMLYVNDLYASTNLIRACSAYDIGTGIIGKRLRESLCVIPIETDDTVEIGWIGLKGKTLTPIEKMFLQILKKQIEEGLAR